MAVLLSDPDALTQADLRLLREQVVRCKQSLDQLTRFYHQSDQQQHERMRIIAFHEAIRDYVVNIHPTANIRFSLDDNCRESWIPADITIRHALINIIENAIRAAHTQVQVHYSLESGSGDNSAGMALIRVQDDGDGIPADVMESMGEPFISSRKGSMGLGIFLANSTLQRHGGRIEMFNLVQSGAQTLIHLPLATPPVINKHPGNGTQK